MLKWKRSEEGYTTTHDGHFEIEPRFNHSVAPSHFSLYHYPTPGDARTRTQVRGYCDTQRDAKAAAERYTQTLAEAAARENASRLDVPMTKLEAMALLRIIGFGNNSHHAKDHPADVAAASAVAERIVRLHQEKE